jgi:hypothetical protein
MIKNQLISRSTIETIRIIDTVNEEKRYVREKFTDKEDLINSQARENIKQICTTVSVIKCYHSMNHYRIRVKRINNGLIIEEYLRYSQKETWEYVVQYGKSIDIRIKIIMKLYKGLKHN